MKERLEMITNVTRVKADIRFISKPTSAAAAANSPSASKQSTPLPVYPTSRPQ